MLMVVLRFIHIVLGVLWVGGVFAISVIVVPGMQKLGIPLDGLMRTLNERKFSQIMMGFGGLTVLAGLTMMTLLSRGHEADYFASPMGRTLSLGGLCAILALVVGGSVMRPTLTKAGKLQADLAANPPKGDDPRKTQLAALQKRIVFFSKLVVILLLITVTCMAIARYV
ncbi:MAG TPA: hypothetical protein VEV39_01040 [Gemmatimonadales bacterium]|nr:hypothetical protein [Gemmatimonadales bacterium]